jgi:ketosteroid isomerase-like protein
VEIDELIDAGDMVVVAHEFARSARTGTPIDRRVFQVWTIQDGEIVTIREYRDRAAALAAVGRPNPRSGGRPE